MSGRGRCAGVVMIALYLSACAAKQVPVPAEPTVASCDAVASHLEAIAVDDASNTRTVDARRRDAEKIRLGCTADNQLTDFAPVVACIMNSATMDTMLGCESLDVDGGFSDYMKSIMDAGAALQVEPSTCAQFSSQVARLRHLELDDVTDLTGDDLASAHVAIDTSMPSFERACAANNQLASFGDIAECLNDADSQSTVARCAEYPNADDFGDWLQSLIHASENAE